MDNLLVSIVQTDLKWEDKQVNLTNLSKLITEEIDTTDVIILPEMFTTGFTMHASKFAEPLNGNTLGWMQHIALHKNAAVTGSFICAENNKFYNRLVWVNPSGKFSFYDKRHLFRMANEEKTFSTNSKKLVVNYKDWKLALLVCYDLRFPVWSRRTSHYDYDVLIYVANWPERRALPWKILLQARAIENQSYVVGVNRIGKDGNGVSYTGDSLCFDFQGKKIARMLSNTTEVKTIQLIKNKLNEFRNKFPAHLDADNFSINLE